MSMDWAAMRSALAGERLPAAFVDLDALDRNVDRISAAFAGSGKTLRIASKSVRCVAVMRRILERGGEGYRGVMGFTAEEGTFLVEEGFDDVLVAYPTVQPAALDLLAGAAAKGATVSIVVDSEAHLEALARAGRDAGVAMRAIVELDVSYRPLGDRIHIGSRRSPVRRPERVLALARAARGIEGVRVAGLMGYEGHIAGLTDDNPFQKALNPVVRVIKRLAIPAVADLRRRTLDLLRAEGVDLEVVNGGGTGSVATTAREAAVTEVTAGSGFLCPHLFDYYTNLDLEPAAFYALEVCRTSDAGFVTCAGGGYVASGPPGWDRAPLPWRPEGIRFVPAEGAGEVQTPLVLPEGAPPLELGDPVVLRHSKAGELAERFRTYLLLRDGRIVDRVPTYRGQDRCFL